ncbi:MAG TPA: hypothetical protein PK467_04875 [Candidatus Wallbacteria bacterium]|nr:MAG: hypothetical protein BWY32_01570 [bacterium ADurb.Bin243]HOT75097.1 hypothetical protein [Candidatus Wallbacteria bacterium]HPG57793.1 hypothetical protein [Candidatus Wallbacteria bacterium]
MFKRLLVAGLILTFVLSLTGDAFAAGVKLQYDLKKGDTTKYRMKMKTTTSIGALGKVEKMDTDTEMNLVQRVIDRDEKNVMYILTAIENVKTIVNGTPADAAINKQAEQVFTLHMEPSGKIISAQGLKSEMSMQQMQLAFPAEPVDVGKSWETVLPATDQIPTTLKMTYTVDKFEKVQGMDCVVIKSKVVSEASKGGVVSQLDVNATGQIFFAFKEGKIVKNAVTGTFGSVTNQVIEGKTEPIVTKVLVDLVMDIVK